MTTLANESPIARLRASRTASTESSTIETTVKGADEPILGSSSTRTGDAKEKYEEEVDDDTDDTSSLVPVMPSPNKKKKKSNDIFVRHVIHCSSSEKEEEKEEATTTTDQEEKEEDKYQEVNGPPLAAKETSNEGTGKKKKKKGVPQDEQGQRDDNKKKRDRYQTSESHSRPLQQPLVQQQQQVRACSYLEPRVLSNNSSGSTNDFSLSVDEGEDDVNDTANHKLDRRPRTFSHDSELSLTWTGGNDDDHDYEDDETTTTHPHIDDHTNIISTFLSRSVDDDATMGTYDTNGSSTVESSTNGGFRSPRDIAMSRRRNNHRGRSHHHSHHHKRRNSDGGVTSPSASRASASTPGAAGCAAPWSSQTESSGLNFASLVHNFEDSLLTKIDKMERAISNTFGMGQLNPAELSALEKEAMEEMGVVSYDDTATVGTAGTAGDGTVGGTFDDDTATVGDDDDNDDEGTTGDETMLDDEDDTIGTAETFTGTGITMGGRSAVFSGLMYNVGGSSEEEKGGSELKMEEKESADEEDTSTGTSPNENNKKDNTKSTEPSTIKAAAIRPTSHVSSSQEGQGKQDEIKSLKDEVMALRDQLKAIERGNGKVQEEEEVTAKDNVASADGVITKTVEVPAVEIPTQQESTPEVAAEDTSVTSSIKIEPCFTTTTTTTTHVDGIDYERGLEVEVADASPVDFKRVSNQKKTRLLPVTPKIRLPTFRFRPDDDVHNAVDYANADDFSNDKDPHFTTLVDETDESALEVLISDAVKVANFSPEEPTYYEEVSTDGAEAVAAAIADPEVAAPKSPVAEVVAEQDSANAIVTGNIDREEDGMDIIEDSVEVSISDLPIIHEDESLEEDSTTATATATSTADDVEKDGMEIIITDLPVIHENESLADGSDGGTEVLFKDSTNTSVHAHGTNVGDVVYEIPSDLSNDNDDAFDDDDDNKSTKSRRSAFSFRAFASRKTKYKRGTIRKSDMSVVSALTSAASTYDADIITQKKAAEAALAETRRLEAETRKILAEQKLQEAKAASMAALAKTIEAERLVKIEQAANKAIQEEEKAQLHAEKLRLKEEKRRAKQIEIEKKDKARKERLEAIELKKEEERMALQIEATKKEIARKKQLEEIELKKKEAREARRLAEEKAAAQKAALEAEAIRLAEERAAAKAEAKRLAEEKAAAQKAALEAEAIRLAEERAAAKAKAKRLAEEKAAAKAEEARIAKEERKKRAAEEARKRVEERKQKVLKALEREEHRKQKVIEARRSIANAATALSKNVHAVGGRLSHNEHTISDGPVDGNTDKLLEVMSDENSKPRHKKLSALSKKTTKVMGERTQSKHSSNKSTADADPCNLFRETTSENKPSNSGYREILPSCDASTSTAKTKKLKSKLQHLRKKEGKSNKKCANLEMETPQYITTINENSSCVVNDESLEVGVQYTPSSVGKSTSSTETPVASNQVSRRLKQKVSLQLHNAEDQVPSAIGGIINVDEAVPVF